MHHLSRLAAAFLLAGLLFAHASAQPPADKDKPLPPAPIDKKSNDGLNLPPGTIIFFSKDARELQKLDAVILTREQFKEFTDQLEQFRKRGDADKPVPPGVCKLQGRIEQRGPQSVARLTATFEFETTAPRSSVFVGCARSQPLAAKLDDGKLPLLAGTDEGLTVLVEQAGKHTLTIELESSLTSRGPKGAETGFEIGLPRAAITLLSFDPIAKVDSFQVAVRREKVAVIERFKGSIDSAPLGPAESLDLSWEPPAPTLGTVTTLSAVADIQVALDDAETTVSGKLRLRGGSKEWRFLAPIVADIAVTRPAPASVSPVDPAAPLRPVGEIAFDPPPAILRPTDANQPPIWKVQFKDRPQEDVIVTMTFRSQRPATDPKSRAFLPVGPFAALDVPPSQQSGTIKVTSPAQLRVSYQLRPEVRRVELPETRGPANAPIEAAFRYNEVPPGANGLPIAPLEIDVRPIQGTIQTATRHELRIGESGCKLVTLVEVTPVRTDVDRIEFDIPAGWENIVAGSPDRSLIDGTTRDGAKRLTVKLAHSQRTPFQIQLDAVAFVALASNEADLRLPRVLNTLDRGGRVVVEVPEAFELHGSTQEWEGDQVGNWPYPFAPLVAGTNGMTRFQSSQRGSPAALHIDWRPRRARTTAVVQTDVMLRDRQAVVSQQWSMRFEEAPPRELRFRGPADLQGLRLTAPGAALDSLPDGEWLVHLPVGGGRDYTFAISYSFPLPEVPSGGRASLAVPLVWPEDVARCESRIRFWRDAAAPGGMVPTLAGGPWVEMPAESVPERESLPSLVLHGSGSSLALEINLAGAAVGTLAQVWVDRALIQVRQSDTGAQDYRARLLIRRWLTRSVDVALPAPPSLRSPEFFLDDRRVDVTEPSPDEGGRRVFRVPLSLPRGGKPVVLEVRYQIAARPDHPIARLTRWEVDLVPPVLRSAVIAGQARWQVAMPDRWVPLDAGGGVRFDQRFGIQHGMLAVLAGRSTTELDQWFTAGLEAVPPSDAGPSSWDVGPANLTGRQSELAPLRLYAASRPAWVFFCTSVAVACAFLVWVLPRLVRWALIVVLLQAAGLLSFGLPQLASQLLVGAQLGVLLSIAGGFVYAFASRRYRRRLKYMPGFSREVGKSSRVRPQVREQSTVDSPPSPGVWATEPAEVTAGEREG